MEIVYNRLAWIKISDLSTSMYNKLLHELTIYKEELVTKDITSYKLYDIQGDHIGIPKQYAMSTFGKPSANDCTLDVLEGYPDFRLELRPNQEAIIPQFLKSFEENGMGGVLQAACGQGKTATMLYILSLFKCRALVLLHKADLMNQWFEAIQKFYGDTPVGWIKQNKQDFLNKYITLASYQTLLSRKDELYRKGFFDYFNVLCVDEIHRCPSYTYSQVLQLINTPVTFGLTATPKRADGLEYVFHYFIGPILAKMESVRVSGKYFQLFWKTPALCYVKKNVARGITLISKDVKRNAKIVEEILKAHAKGRKVLALSDRVAQLEGIEEAIRNNLLSRGLHASVSLYIGGMKDHEYKEAKKSKIILGTYGMLSEGSDLPDADTLLLLTPRGNVEQMVGRIQRVHAGKKSLIVYDIVDVNMGLFVGLGKKRVKTYNQLGFTLYE